VKTQLVRGKNDTSIGGSRLLSERKIVLHLHRSETQWVREVAAEKKWYEPSHRSRGLKVTKRTIKGESKEILTKTPCQYWTIT